MQLLVNYLFLVYLFFFIFNFFLLNLAVTNATILTREEYIIKTSLESLYKIHYVVKTGNEIFDAVFNSNMESEKVKKS